MRLEAITVGLLRRAVGLYEQHAWHGSSEVPVTLPGADGDAFEVCRSAFRDETQIEGRHTVRRYSLRLGNPRYPFMKLVLQEHLVEGEFFLEVDTHDGMFELADDSEAESFAELKAYNERVKDAVEGALAEAGLPTATGLKGLVQTLPTGRVEPNGRTILLVDDDQAIAATLALLLRGRGYEVEVLHDGMDAVEGADASRHDLILMDNEMPRLNGFEACQELKSRPATADIPVLIATAGALTLRQLDLADGFLVKPFRIELLLNMLDHMLARR